jgi:hypothetical protein
MFQHIPDQFTLPNHQGLPVESPEYLRSRGDLVVQHLQCPALFFRCKLYRRHLSNLLQFNTYIAHLQQLQLRYVPPIPDLTAHKDQGADTNFMPSSSCRAKPHV